MRAFLRLLGYLRPHRWLVLLAMLCLLLGQPLGVLHPLFWKFVVDEVILADQPALVEWVGNSRLGLLTAALGLMFLANTVGTALGALRGLALGVASHRLGLDLRNDLYRRIQSHALKFFHEHRSGDLVSRVTGDVDSVQSLATNGVDELIGSILQLLIVWTIILVLVSWQVALAVVLPMAAVGVLLYHFNKRVRPLYRQARDRLGDVSAVVQENMLGMLVIKSFGRENHEGNRVGRENRRYYDAAVRSIVVRTQYMPFIQAVGFISNVVMLGVGAYFVLQGSMTVGGLIALRGYWWYLFAPVWSLAQINDMIQRSLAAAGRIFDIMNEPQEVVDRPNAQRLDRVEGAVRFDRVTFAHEGRDTTLLDVSLDVAPGDSVGLCGPSGAGKSTMLALLMRLYDPDEGAVLVDGRDVRDLQQASLRSHMAVVTQEPFLFNDTLRGNILYGRPDATEQQMIAAARQANAHQFIIGLPQGYDTRIGERGVKLSGGQKQRICIARAFLADPRILLLDEATASVEPESEAIIQAALARLMTGRTSFIVSHRLSMIRDCTTILSIQDGRMIERGRHDELMAANGWYARMYRLQTGQEDFVGSDT